jgi:hypothetical protein
MARNGLPAARSHGARRSFVIALLAMLTLAGCADSNGGRYRVRADPGSRHSFKYVQDRTSGLWVHRECEVRVSTKRRLPDPISPDEHGDLLHSSRFTPQSVGTGNLVPEQFVVRDGYRVWNFRELLTEDDYAGETRFGVQVEWPVDGGPSKHEPLELFALPPPGNTPPDQWSAWRTADSTRTDAFGWWEEVHNAPPEATSEIQYPFELRFRLLLKDHVYVE